MATPTITPATPEVTINNTAAEIKTALESQAATADPTPQPAVAPATPATPEPYTVTETPEGVEIKLETGAVYKGKNWQEAALAAARGKVEADKYLHQLKTQQPAAPAVEPAAPATPAEDPTEIATRKWVIEQVAKELGIPAEKFVEITSQMFQHTQQNTLAVAWADFTQKCPDYADTPENANALVEYLPQDVVAQNRPPTAQELQNAHAIALYNKRYQPAQVATRTPQSPVPPVMPTASGVQPGEPDPYKMSMDELRKQAFGQ